MRLDAFAMTPFVRCPTTLRNRTYLKRATCFSLGAARLLGRVSSIRASGAPPVSLATSRAAARSGLPCQMVAFLLPDNRLLGVRWRVADSSHNSKHQRREVREYLAASTSPIRAGRFHGQPRYRVTETRHTYRSSSSSHLSPPRTPIRSDLRRRHRPDRWAWPGAYGRRRMSSTPRMIQILLPSGDHHGIRFA